MAARASAWSRTVTRASQGGTAGADHNIAHGNCFAEDELKLVLDAGCTITATCLTEALNYEQPRCSAASRSSAPRVAGTDCDPYFNSSMLW